MTWVDLGLAGTVIAIGACLQLGLGFGMGMLAAPILALIDPVLVPVPLLCYTLLLSTILVWRERGAIDLPAMGWALTGRVPGNVAGALAIAALSPRGLRLTIGLVIIAGVLVSLVGWAPTRRPPNLVAAGAASGFMGTATSVGGPPMALLYQRVTGAHLRATLAGYFLVGAMLSLASLALLGEVTPQRLTATAALFPFALVGLAAARPATRLLDRGYTRPVILAISGVSAGVLVLRAFAG